MTVSDGEPYTAFHLNVLAMPWKAHTKPQAASAAVDWLPSTTDAGTLATATI